MLTKKLKKLRTMNLLTQDELAKKLDISRVRYNNYETGKRSPDLDTLHQIADFFGVTIDYLIGRSENQNNIKLVPSILLEVKTIDEDLEEILHKIELICNDLMFKGEVLDNITKIALFNSLKNVMEMTDKMIQFKEHI